VLVTGGSGFLGSHLVARLIKEGATVGALARHEGQVAQLPERGQVEFIRCDLTDARQAGEAIRAFAPQILFHFASHPDAPEDVGQAAACIQGNIVTTLHALEGVRRGAGGIFVYGDSCKVYGDSAGAYREHLPLRPKSSYAITKATGWQICQLYGRLHGIAVVSVRPTMIYGPRQGPNLITAVVRAVLGGQREVRLQGGTQTRAPLFIDDAIDAFVATARRGAGLAGRVINIGGGCERSVAELAARIVDVMGGDVRILAMPNQVRPTDTARSVCDNQAAKALLQWEPRTDLETGLARTIEYLIEARGVAAAGLAAGEGSAPP
jgi:UDP-glucose 4-epimerase